MCNNNNSSTLFCTLRTSRRIVFTVKSTDNFNLIILISRLYYSNNSNSCMFSSYSLSSQVTINLSDRHFEVICS